ncbi:MAG: hypothetical protein ABSB35_39955, partial [Bryobacteraceae bacterium]
VEETGSDTERIKTRHRSRSPHAQIIRTTRFEDRSAHNSGDNLAGRRCYETRSTQFVSSVHGALHYSEREDFARESQNGKLSER